MKNTNISSNNDEYLKLTELCEWLKVKPSTVHSYCKKKLMPQPLKIFGLLLWSKKSIEEWIHSKQAE